jgi:uncharacterized protein with ATP-grasp and redox domains
MRIIHQCIPCILDDIIEAAHLEIQDPKDRQTVVRQSLEFMAKNLGEGLIPSHYITQVHRILKKTANITTPFAAQRKACNRIGRAIAEDLWSSLKKLGQLERFTILVQWVIAGNELDFRTVGTGYGLNLQEIAGRLEKTVEKGLEINQISDIYQTVLNAHRILYIPDNVGELAFDILLIREIKSYGCEVLVPMRGGPITSDATMEDALELGLDKVANRLISAGPDTLGISPYEMSPELKEALSWAEVILAKGQANLYALTELAPKIKAPVIHLLRTKCNYASSRFNRSGKIGVAAILNGTG